MARPARNRSPEKLQAGKAVIDHEAVADAGQALALHAERMALVEQQYDPGMPYSIDLYVGRLRLLMAETGARLVEMGLMLVQVREHEPQARYLEVLDKAGIAPRFAQRAMQAAVKFGRTAKSKQLAAQLGSAKVLELLAEDGEDIAELADGGTLAGYTADEFASMTKRELVAAIRKQRDEKAADEEIIQKKDERINKLMRERRAAGKDPIRDQVKPSLDALDSLSTDVAENLTRQRKLIDEIEIAFTEAGQEVPADIIERIDTNRRYAADWLRIVCTDLGE